MGSSRDSTDSFEAVDELEDGVPRDLASGGELGGTLKEEPMETDEQLPLDKGGEQEEVKEEENKENKEEAEVEREEIKEDEERVKEENNPELIVPQTHEIVIPSYSRWFHLNRINEIEKKSLPEFFTNRIPSKTPQVYVKYRNFMVNSYRLNPNEYFTVTSARRNLCGDAGCIFRVHKFLAKWGLINYQVNAKVIPKAVEPPFTGEFSTRHDAPRGLFPFQSYKPAVQIPDMSRLKKMMTQLRDPAQVTEPANSERETNSDNSGAAPTSVKREMVPPAVSSKPPKRPKLEEMVDKDWSKDDLMKLLKAIQQHGADWPQIAKEVGNKTPEQCILRFLQLPIEDNFLETEENLGPLKYGAHLPFSKADNPVMSTIAFLIGLVDPKTVQEMTKRAITSITGEDGTPTKDTQGQAEPKQEENQQDETIGSAVKEATEVAISTIGVRSHVFANNEERQLNAIANELVTTQMKKVELKLKLLDTMEKSLEIERKTLLKQQEEVFIQKFSFAKHAIGILEKFDRLLNEDEQDPAKLKEHMESLRKTVMNPPTFSISTVTDSVPNSASNGSNQTPGTVNNEASLGPFDEPSVKPVSIDAPQLYRYWSG
ncbi:HDL395Cp [Eremothecium sinecaudum]|uniref:HDL395Cp n=1 Tax=Eremothecium sinecaudum TaxID=45286 RepID=A0A0X8HRZ3_9SACH|nr:HDL395Cp [Eremothecium sinecaudum]AMD20349.1 HDL395Cp [Eremothecium sinecaudum]